MGDRVRCAASAGCPLHLAYMTFASTNRVGFTSPQSLAWLRANVCKTKESMVLLASLEDMARSVDSALAAAKQWKDALVRVDSTFFASLCSDEILASCTNLEALSKNQVKCAHFLFLSTLHEDILQHFKLMPPERAQYHFMIGEMTKDK
jgi:hypothetical protein